MGVSCGAMSHMSSVPGWAQPAKQDGPRPGGFPPVRYRRDMATRGPSGFAMFFASAAVIAYGMYTVGQGNIKRRELREEKFASRRAIVPLWQAEEDRRWVAAKAAATAMEAEIMKDVPGWKAGASVYSEGCKWVPPATQKGL